jgi:hypothetical protein
MDHSPDTILRDWKLIAAYVIVGFGLCVFLITSPKLAFYAALCLLVLGVVILLLSK